MDLVKNTEKYAEKRLVEKKLFSKQAFAE